MTVESRPGKVTQEPMSQEEEIAKLFSNEGPPIGVINAFAGVLYDIKNLFAKQPPKQKPIESQPTETNLPQES